MSQQSTSRIDELCTRTICMIDSRKSYKPWTQNYAHAPQWCTRYCQCSNHSILKITNSHDGENTPNNQSDDLPPGVVILGYSIVSQPLKLNLVTGLSCDWRNVLKMIPKKLYRRTPCWFKNVRGSKNCYCLSFFFSNCYSMSFRKEEAPRMASSSSNTKLVRWRSFVSTIIAIAFLPQCRTLLYS